MRTYPKDRGASLNDSLTNQIWDNVSIKVNTKFMDDMYLYVEHANESTKKTFSTNKRIQKCCKI